MRFLEMKIVAAIIVALMLPPAISYAAQETGTRIYVVNGNVLVMQGKNSSHRVINSEPIVSDTIINTGDKSAALLRFEDGQVVTMQANSTFHVRDYRYDARQIQNSNITFSMLKGGMRFVTGLIGQQNKQAFRLLSPNATIRVRGTEFMFTMVGKTMYGQVLTGNIGMTNAAGTVVIDAGQSAVVASSSSLAAVVSASAVPSGTFSELLSIPVNPSAIIAPTPMPASALVPAAVSGAAAASLTGAPKSIAGSALVGLVGAKSDSTQVQKTVSPEIGLQKPAEPAKVADQKEMGADSKSGRGLTGKIGTLGYGAELNFGISDSVSARVGFNNYSYKYNANSSAVNYDFKLQLQTASAVVDWYPFAGSFRSSIGLLYDNNKVSFGANPTGGSFIINGVTYSTAQVSSLQGTITFNKAAPYIGIGWGNPVAKDKGWGLVSDIGVLYQNTPKIDLAVTCTDPLICAQLQTDAMAEHTKLQNDFRNYKWWPVVSIGIFYQW